MPGRRNGTQRILAGLALVLAAVAAGAPASARPRPPVNVIVDEDGAVDDLVALSLLLRAPAVRVRAVTVCPGDAFLDPAVRATRLVLGRLGPPKATVAAGHFVGLNPFPLEWRSQTSEAMAASERLPARKTAAAPLAKEDAASHLVRLLSGRRRYVIVETGPLTNIADALRLQPAIARRIRRIYVMGGAVRTGGNVEPGPTSDGSAEWNLFNNPPAAAAVIASGVPITLVPLDATNRAPLTRAFVERLAAQSSDASQLAAAMMRVALSANGDSPYYFWDSMTAASLIDPGVVTTKTLKLKVSTDGRAQGRTVEAPDGSPVRVALDADGPRLEALVLSTLAR